MISALAWVPRGACKQQPQHAEPSPEELQAVQGQLQKRAERGLVGEDGDEDADEGEGMSGDEEEDSEQMEEAGSSGEAEDKGSEGAVARARAAAAAVASSSGGGSKRSSSKAAANTDSIEASLRELDMDHYDDDDEGPNVVSRSMGGQVQDVYPEEDPYMVGGGDSEEGSEKADLEIKPTDLVIMAARNEDDVNTLELWVYEEAESAGDDANVYVHHELMLPAFPLCLAWLDCPIVRQHGSGDTSTSGSIPDPGAHGNYVAIGSMEPGIEIWDLDVIDAVEPVVTLGGVDKAASEAAFEEAKEAAGGKLDKAKKKKLKEKVKKKGPAFLPGSHTDAVLGLSWNREYRNVLASASADHTVKVWDVARQTVEHTFKHHTDKVQAVAWNPVETPVLLTGGFDKLAALVDVRTPSTQPARWQLSADVESVLWSPHDPTNFLVSSEDGLVATYDARRGAGSPPVFRLAAHNKPTCAMSFCPAAPGLLATAATDKKTKIWDISGGVPTLIATQDLQVGAVFTMGFCADAPHLLAVGGAMGSVVVWDVRANQDVARRFPQLLQQQQPQGQEDQES